LGAGWRPVTRPVTATSATAVYKFCRVFRKDNADGTVQYRACCLLWGCDAYDFNEHGEPPLKAAVADVTNLKRHFSRDSASPEHAALAVGMDILCTKRLALSSRTSVRPRASLSHEKERESHERERVRERERERATRERERERG
jgi:hypothetical protein